MPIAVAPFLPPLLAVLACAPLRAQATATVVGEPAAGELPAAVAAACARGGDNAAQLAAAWRQAPADQRPSVAVLLQHMPDADARALDAAFLLREVRQAHAARAAVPWGAELDDALFANFVLPYT
ncbi:MAG: hypothetical protein ACK56S_11015, partial [Planctomycetota bacterium]